MSPSFDIIGLGEILWDCFPDRRLPGGAPANVAFHAQQLGLTAAVATRVGTDPLGDELLQFLQSKGLRTDLVQLDPEHATGTVTVKPHPDRTDYTFLENSAWDFLESTDEWLEAASRAKAVCFGTLAQRRERSRRTIHEMLAEANSDCLIVYDVNLRPPFFEPEWIHESLRQAKIVKLNDEEVRTLSAMFSVHARTDDEFARWLMRTYDTELVCVTRGGNGGAGGDERRVLRSLRHRRRRDRYRRRRRRIHGGADQIAAGRLAAAEIAGIRQPDRRAGRRLPRRHADARPDG